MVGEGSHGTPLVGEDRHTYNDQEADPSSECFLPIFQKLACQQLSYHFLVQNQQKIFFRNVEVSYLFLLSCSQNQKNENDEDAQVAVASQVLYRDSHQEARKEEDEDMGTCDDDEESCDVTSSEEGT